MCVEAGFVKSGHNCIRHFTIFNISYKNYSTNCIHNTFRHASIMLELGTIRIKNDMINKNYATKYVIKLTYLV